MDINAVPCAQNKEVKSLGLQIFELLDGCTPEEKREALNEAEERIHQMFDRKLAEAQGHCKSMEQAWQVFKTGARVG